MKTYQLIEHIGGGLASVYYIDGRRVSNHEFSIISNKGHSAGGRVDCMSTKCKPLSGGRLRRTNYTTVTIE